MEYRRMRGIAVVHFTLAGKYGADVFPIIITLSAKVASQGIDCTDKPIREPVHYGNHVGKLFDSRKTC